MSYTKQKIADITRPSGSHHTSLSVDELTAMAKMDYLDQPSHTLRETTLITAELIEEEPFFEVIHQLYTQDGNPFVMALASVCNAIVTQQSSFFVISRRSLWRLIKEDKNHQMPFELGWKKYAAVLSFLWEAKIIERIERSEGKKAGIFKTVHWALLESIYAYQLEDYGLDPSLTPLPQLLEDPRIKKWRVLEYKSVREFRDNWNGK